MDRIIDQKLDVCVQWDCQAERVNPGFFIFKLIVFYWEIVKNVIDLQQFQFLIKNDLVTINDGIDLCID